MADPRWRLFWHNDVIVTWCDVTITRDEYQKKEFRTYNTSYKFHGDCLNILEVTWGGPYVNPPPVWEGLKKPGLNGVNWRETSF